MKYGGCVCVTNQCNKVLYTGVTVELRARIWEHKTRKKNKPHLERFVGRY